MNYLKKNLVWVSVLAVALGYFVDLFDLLLFSSVRVESLKALNITGEQGTYYASNLLNLTVLGMVIGGLFWGIIADKKGRLSVLFASIAMYTVANFINGWVTNIHVYQLCRFLAGLGLAGELGVGITLVSEALPRNKRTLGAAIITASGMLGAVSSGILASLLKGSTVWGVSSWRFLFILAGFFGLALLFFRISVAESAVFEKSQSSHNRGNLLYLLGDGRLLKKYLYCVCSGLPVFFIIGTFISLSPEYGRAFGINGIQASMAVACCYIAISVADFLGTLLSRRLRSRKKILYIFLLIQVASVLVFLFVPYLNVTDYYIRCAFLGVGIGYWGVLIVNSVEQFGTNLRATVATSVPNLIRGALFPLSEFIFNPLKSHFGLLYSGAITALLTVAIALYSVSQLTDRFENNIDFIDN